MRRIYFRIFFRFYQSKYVISCFFTFGLLLSFLAASAVGEALLPAMRMVQFSHVSIIGLLSALIIPVFISAFAVYSNESWIIPILAFLKSFTFGYCAFAITAAFGSAGWLVRYLILFSDIHLICILWWFWLRHYPEKGKRILLDTAIAVTTAVFICLLDLLLIEPFRLLLYQ